MLVRFNGGLREGSRVIIDVTTEVNYSSNFMQAFLEYKYILKTYTQ